MKRILVALTLLFVFAVPAAAQNAETRGEFFAGYVFNRMDSGAFLEDLGLVLGEGRPGALNLNGLNLSVGVALGDNSVTDTVSLVFDFGGYFSDIGPSENTDLNIYTLAAGPQLTNRKHRYFHPFVRALFGISYVKGEVNDIDTDNTGFVFICGGGVDIRSGDHFAFRMVQLDYMLMRHVDTNVHNFRVATGVAFPF
jgi:hypothetical protein